MQPYLWLNWFSGLLQLKCYNCCHGTNFQNHYCIKQFILGLKHHMQNKTTWGQTKWSVFLALIDSSIYHNKWLLLHLTKRGKQQTAWLFIFIFHQLWMTLTEQSVVPCQPNQNLLHIECWQGFVRFKSHHIWQGKMFCCCTKRNRLLKVMFNQQSPQCSWTSV